MDFREALQAGKIGIGGASDHWTRLFGQKVLGGYGEGYAEGAIASFTDGVNAPVDKLLVAINPVQSGTGDPSPDNVRPISGWTGANVVRCGKNLFNVLLVDEIVINKQSHATRYGVEITKEGTYTVSAQDSGQYMYCRVFNTDGTTKTTYYVVAQSTIRNATFTIAKGESFSVYSANTDTFEQAIRRFGVWQPQIELDDTATTYSPYTGTTYPITFPSEAGTVYGGELDVTSGVLTVTQVLLDLDNTRVFYNTGYVCWIFSNSMPAYFPGNYAVPTDMISSIGYKPASFYGYKRDNKMGVTNQGKIFVGNNSDTDKPTGQLTYTLAEPLTYQLTPTEVTTLLGVNNIWADTGDVKVWYERKK